MAINLNADMGSVFKNLINKHGGGTNASASMEAYKNAVVILILIAILSASYINFIYLPMQAENLKKKEELDKVLEMKNQLAVLDNQIAILQKKLDKSKEKYIESLSHFGNSEDLGELYQTVSALAAKYNLVVLNVREIPPAPKTDAKTPAVSPNTPPTPAPAVAKNKIDVKEIVVELELKGRYGDYIRFKEDLAIAEVFLKVNTETVMVKNETTDQGGIYVKLNLSTYAIDKKPFQGIIADKANEKTK